MQKTAKFNIGDRVIHQKLGYRAVVIDADPLFQASGRYNPGALNREFATQNPWYRVLVDESSQIAYVEENLLIADTSHEGINNPNIQEYLVERHGNYYSSTRRH